jgi:hypothetical protein
VDVYGGVLSASFLYVDFIAARLPTIPGLVRLFMLLPGLSLAVISLMLRSVRSYHFIQSWSKAFR